MIPYALRASGIIAAGSFETGKYVIYFVTPLQARNPRSQTCLKVSLLGRLSFFVHTKNDSLYDS